MSNGLKVFSFLGFTYYRQTVYLNPNPKSDRREYKTRFIQEALVEFYNPEILYVLLTDKVENSYPAKWEKGNKVTASKTNWKKLQTKLADRQVKIAAIRNIPETGTPDNIWNIFNKITECLEEGDRVIFDITNGFRSLPIVALLAISYLKTVKNIEIAGLVYGAFDRENNRTPIYDLLPIVELLDWITATDKFIKTGSGQELSKLIEYSDRSNLDNLNLAQNINNIAQGLHLLRPMNVMEEAMKLPKNIAKVSPTVSRSIPPFASLLERVEADYGKYGLNDPAEFKTNGKEALSKMLAMAQWYKEKGQYVQALSLAREWLPSLLCWHFSLNVLDKDDRYAMEAILNYGKPKGEEQEEKYLAKWEVIPLAIRDSLKLLWTGRIETNIANIRNDIAHSGFRKNPRTIEEIVIQTDKVIDELQKIANAWGI